MNSSFCKSWCISTSMQEMDCQILIMYFFSDKYDWTKFLPIYDNLDFCRDVKHIKID